MRKTLTAVIGVILFGALASIGLAEQARQAEQTSPPTMAGPGMMKMANPENRMNRLTYGLNLTQEQKEKIKPILEKEADKVNAVIEDSTLSKQEKRTRIREIHASTFQQIKPMLTPEQLKKHDEMMKSGKGMPGGMGRVTPANRLQRLSSALNLSEEQQTKIKPILDEESAKIKAVNEDKTLSRQQKRAKVREIHSATFEQIKPLLTPEQLKKHEEMLKSGKGMRGKKGHATPANRLKRLSSALNLSEEQQAKINPIIHEETVKIKAVNGDKTLSKQQKRDKVREIHAATFEQIKPLLTPEQLKKHEEMMKQRKK